MKNRATEDWQKRDVMEKILKVWIENPSYELGVWWDENGNLIPQHKQVKEKVKAHIFISWRYIKALMSVEDERFQKITSEKLPGFTAYK